MALIKCVECGRKISDKAISCPNCGCPVEKKVEEDIGKEAKEVKEKPKKDKKDDLSVGQWLLILFVVPIILAFLGGAFSDSDKGESRGIVATADGIHEINSNDFEILEAETSRDGDTYTVKGKIKQNIEDSYTGIMITINMLDEDGDKVREADGLQYSEYLGDNIWSFEVSGNDPDNVVRGYELYSCYGI